MDHWSSVVIRTLIDDRRQVVALTREDRLGAGDESSSSATKSSIASIPEDSHVKCDGMERAKANCRDQGIDLVGEWVVSGGPAVEAVAQALEVRERLASLLDRMLSTHTDSTRSPRTQSDRASSSGRAGAAGTGSG